MAVPKKKTSVSRKGKRRGGQTHKMAPKSTSKCSITGEVTLRHCVSPSGYYKGNKVMEVRADRVKDEDETAE